MRARLWARCGPVLVGSLLAGCLAFTPAPDEPLSYGTTSAGVLRSGQRLPDRGTGFVRARPGEATAYGTPRLISAIERAVVGVVERFGGSAPMRVGDLSSPLGGRHHRHGSHRSGRDVDVLFYMTDATGRSRQGRGWLAYNRFGYAIDRHTGEGANRGLFFFDDARNWHFVRSLVLDDEAAVQWLFVSWGVKARLLRWGIAHETDPRVLSRAAYVLQQPTNASPHDDHFHVRTFCTARERAHGCINRGPMWSWLRDAEEKPETFNGEALDDEALMREIGEPIEEEEED